MRNPSRRGSRSCTSPRSRSSSRARARHGWKSRGASFAGRARLEASASLTSDAASFKPLAVLRIGVALILLAQARVLWDYRELLLSETGPLKWAVIDLM